MAHVGPYVGWIADRFRVPVDRVALHFPGRLKIGVDADYTTLVTLIARHLRGDRYPRSGDFESIMVSHPRVLNLIHYRTRFHETLTQQLVQLSRLAGPSFHGFRLDLEWPQLLGAPQDLKTYREKFPEKFLILHVGKEAVSEERSLKALKAVLRSFIPSIHGILVDPRDFAWTSGSPGGTHTAAKRLAEIAKELRLNIAIAGGMDERVVHLVDPLIEEVPDLSFDAHRRLADLALVRRYLRQ